MNGDAGGAPNPGEGAALGNGEVIAGGFARFKAPGPRVVFIRGASFQPPFSWRLGGGANEGAAAGWF